MTEPRHSWARRVLAWLPLPLAQSPERVVLNFACIMLGTSALFIPGRGSMVGFWPDWVAPVWGLAMIIGGCAVIAGMQRHKTTLERLGYRLVGPACFAFGVSVLVVFGLDAVRTGVIFLAFALAKAIRMLVSSAARDAVLEVGERMDRDEQGPE